MDSVTNGLMGIRAVPSPRIFGLEPALPIALCRQNPTIGRRVSEIRRISPDTRDRIGKAHAHAHVGLVSVTESEIRAQY